MSIAVGMIETLGFPAVVEAADAMVKSAHVTLGAYLGFRGVVLYRPRDSWK